MRSDVGVFVAAALAWAAFIYKLRHFRQRKTEPGANALRALVTLLGLVALLFSLLPRTVAAPIDDFIGLSGTVRLVTNMIAMVTCLAVLAWLLFLSRPEEEARSRLIVHTRILAAFLIGVLILFAFDHPPVTPDREFAGAHMHLFILYLSYVETRLIVLSWRYATMVEEPLLRLGQRLVAAAILFGMLFLLTELVYLIETDLGLDFYGSPAVSRPLYVVAATLLVIGLTLPAWGPQVGLDAVWWRVSRWYATRRLRPLWNVVTTACPGVILDRAFLAASPYGSRIAAERLPVEIHDGWLQLRYHLSADDVRLINELALQRGIRDQKIGAAIAAARLMVAVRRKHDKVRLPLSATPPVEYLGAGGTDTLVAEVRYLCAVSRNLRSRFVRDVLARIAADPVPVALRQCPGAN